MAGGAAPLGTARFYLRPRSGGMGFRAVWIDLADFDPGEYTFTSGRNVSGCEPSIIATRPATGASAWSPMTNRSEGTCGADCVVA
jgi:hypothetical protein